MRNHLTKFKAIDFISHIYHNLITTLPQQPYHKPNHNFISSQQLHNFISTNSSQLHFNKLFNNYSDRSSTTLLITNFHNIIQELEDYSLHTFTTLSQTLHRIFQQVSTNSSTSFNKMNEYRFSFTAYSTNYDTVLQHNIICAFILIDHDTILYQYFNNILHRQSIFHFSTFLHHIFNKHSTNSYKAFFTTFFATFFATFFTTN